MESTKFKALVNPCVDSRVHISDGWVEWFDTSRDSESSSIAKMFIDVCLLDSYKTRISILNGYLKLLAMVDVTYHKKPSDIKGELLYADGLETFKVYSSCHNFEKHINISATSNSHILCDLEKQFGFKKFVDLMEGAD